MEGQVQVKKVVEGLNREMLEKEEEKEDLEVGLAALDSTANKENGGWGLQKPQQNRLEN